MNRLKYFAKLKSNPKEKKGPIFCIILSIEPSKQVKGS